MEFKKNIERRAYAIKIIAEDAGQEAGRVFLYILYNDLHLEPFAYLEDLFVGEVWRSQGLGKQLMQMAVEEARQQGCYKLVLTSRDGRDGLHEWYAKLGFKQWGSEFRMDFK
jgi:GNAT superfamily N-acetyltransferase